MFDRSTITDEVGSAIARLAPPPALIIGASVTPWGVQEWMYAVSTVYIAIQIVYLCWKWRREWRAKSGG
jgi:hypothetical protein